MTIAWWVWIALGLVLFAAEMATPGGFYLMFIGLAAIVVGLCAPVVTVNWVQVVIFAVLSVVFVTLLRKPLVERLRISTPKADQPEFIGETGKTLEDIAPGATGKVELRGVSWSAQNSSAQALAMGSSCKVTGRDGLKLIVQ